MAIVVGVDGSAESLEALRWALDEARLRKTTVRAVHVRQYPSTMVIDDPFLGGPDVDPLLLEPAELPHLAQAHLSELVREAAPDPDAVEQQVVHGHPAEGLIEAANDAELRQSAVGNTVGGEARTIHRVRSRRTANRTIFLRRTRNDVSV